MRVNTLPLTALAITSTSVQFTFRRLTRWCVFIVHSCCAAVKRQMETSRLPNPAAEIPQEMANTCTGSTPHTEIQFYSKGRFLSFATAMSETARYPKSTPAVRLAEGCQILSCKGPQSLSRTASPAARVKSRYAFILDLLQYSVIFTVSIIHINMAASRVPQLGEP